MGSRSGGDRLASCITCRAVSWHGLLGKFFPKPAAGHSLGLSRQETEEFSVGSQRVLLTQRRTLA